MNKDQIKGRAQNLKGRAKQAVGIVTGNRATEVEGTIDRTKGAVRQKVGDVKEEMARNTDESAGE